MSEQLSDSPIGPLCTQGHPISILGGYCSICAHCEVCHKQLTAVEYSWTLQQSRRLELPPEFRHPGCFKEIERLTLQSETIEIPRALFDRLNACRLLLEPCEDLNITSNRADVTTNCQRWIHLQAQNRTHEEFQEYLFMAMIRMEEAAAMLSLATRPNRRAIEADIAKRDTENYREAKAQRVKNADSAPNTHARTERKQLSKEDKAIAAFQKLGLSEEEARASVLQARGKATDPPSETTSETVN